MRTNERIAVKQTRTLSRRLRGAAVATIAVAAVVAAACGGAGASTSSTATPGGTSASAAEAGRTPGRFRNGTPPAAVQTAIAEGTPFGPGNRTPAPDFQTAIAEGTPASALRGGFGGANGARVTTALAGILGIDEATLRSELQAPGASIEKVATAHGIDRAALRQRLIDAVRQSLNDAVKNGTLTQAMADQSASQFEANVDNTLDRVGGGGMLGGPGGAPPSDATPGP